jgi:BirA family biotin operon repressor/biotin-[acetyl-CoA-carboxylase] ligase
LGRDVVVLLPDGASVRGIATAVDEGGMLVVRQADGVERSWSSGDVIHVRGQG